MNPNAAMRQILAADSSLSTEVSSKFYGMPGLARDALDSKAVSFRVSASERDNTGALLNVTYDVACWGGNPASVDAVGNAWGVYDKVFAALDGKTNMSVAAGYLIEMTEVQPGIDAWHEDIDRPYVAAQYQAIFRR